MGCDSIAANCYVTRKVLDGALEDIQKKRHKRDPFREGYLRLCLSVFEPAAQVQAAM